jgi:outer membrane phospholipase A
MFRRVGFRAMAGTAALAIALLAFTVPGSAAAETRAAPAVLKDVATGFCLDSNGNRQVYTLSCNGGSYQKWTLSKGRFGTTLKDVATGFCLDSNANRQVYTLGCNGGSYQEWTLSKGRFGTTLKNVATGFCLDSNGNREVYTLGCNGGSYQQWNGI